MTKAFLEPLVLKPENEKFIREAFSKSNMDRVKQFDAIKRPKLKKQKIENYLSLTFSRLHYYL